jgi:restriction system protein
MIRLVGTEFAAVAQLVLPLLCVAGAIASAVRCRKGRRLTRDAADAPAADLLDGMDWRDFEWLVSEAFRRQGYAAAATPAGADGGVDLVLRKDGEKFLVQCKHWRAFAVGVEVVRELYGVMAARGATGGFVVTSGKFTDPAREFADGRNITLMDGARLRVLLGTAGASSTAGRRRSIENSPDTEHVAAPPCPRCAKPMVKRRARVGVNAGSVFLGCPDFPRCRGKRDLPVEIASARPQRP